MRRVRLPFATPGQLDAEAVALALPKLGVPLPFPQAAPEILRLAGEVTYCDAGARDRYFSVGDDDPVQIRLTFSWNAGRESEELRCDECRFRFDHCVHSAAVRLAHLWGSEPARIVLETPAWRHALLPLLGAAPRTAPAAEGPSHDGWVRYILNDDGGPGFESLPPAASALDALLQRQIVKRSKRTGAALAPSKFPQKLEDAASKVLLTEADREIDSYFQQLRTLQSLSKSRWAGPDGRTLRVLEDLVGRALGMLTEVSDLHYGGAQIKATSEPVTPRITVDDGAPGLLALRWKPEIQSVWDAGPGYVLTAEGEFRPLHRSTPPEVRAQLHLALPSVPVTSAGEFLREIVLKTEVPIDLRARNLPHIRGASSPWTIPRPGSSSARRRACLAWASAIRRSRRTRCSRCKDSSPAPIRRRSRATRLWPCSMRSPRRAPSSRPPGRSSSMRVWPGSSPLAVSRPRSAFSRVWTGSTWTWTSAERARPRPAWAC